jgi:putative oxidoreductase
MSDTIFNLAMLILRVTLGVIMVSHGIPKIQKRVVLGKKWHEHYGVPNSTVLATGILQLVGGVMLVLGLFTNIVAVLMTLDMLAALYICIFNPHHKEPFNSVTPVKGWDVNLLLVASLLVVVLLGAGAWSLEGVWPVLGWWFW